MDDAALLRYSRQIMLPQVDAEGQEHLAECHALVVGLGGLGSPIAMYLAAAGVGRLTLNDADAVDLSNLQRQLVHATADIGRSKVESARDRLQALNPLIRVDVVDQRLSPEALGEQVRAVDVVVDGTDNFATRFALNAACIATRTPLVSGAAVRFEGQVTVFDPRLEASPCYRCLYKEGTEEDLRCTENGVLAPVVGIIGTIQANEALKVLLGIGEPLVGRLLVLDALRMDWRTLRLRRDPACPACSPRP